MLRASLGKVVHTVKRTGTYAAKVPPPELHNIAVHVRAVVYTWTIHPLSSFGLCTPLMNRPLDYSTLADVTPDPGPHGR